MAATIDHLSLHHRITVLREFVDSNGVQRSVGDCGVIVGIDLDWATHDVTLVWEREGRRESMVFALAATSGPRNGHMREYFERGEYVAPPASVREFAPNVGLVPSAPVVLPEVGRELVRGVQRLGAAIDRVWALAGRRRFDEAEEQLQALVDAPPDSLAAALGSVAERHAFDEDASVYEWLRDRAIQRWYGWGAEATSGGDGAARWLEIRPAIERFAHLDQWRKSNR